MPYCLKFVLKSFFVCFSKKQTYHIYLPKDCLKSVINQSSVVHSLDKVFPLQNNVKSLDPSYKMDLDFWDCFGMGKSLSYNSINTVQSSR